MEPEITPEQQAQLNMWAGQRDAILLEISGLTTEKEDLKKTNRELSDSNKDIETRMNIIRGRIEELIIKEKELPERILKDVASLNSNRTTLEAEITLLEKVIKTLEKQKTSLGKDVDSELKTFESLHKKAGLLEEVIGHVTQISSKNEKHVIALVDDLKTGLEELVSKNNVAIGKTNIVINELPKVFLEVQRKSLVREVINPKKP